MLSKQLPKLAMTPHFCKSLNLNWIMKWFPAPAHTSRIRYPTNVRM